MNKNLKKIDKNKNMLMLEDLFISSDLYHNF